LPKNFFSCIIIIRKHKPYNEVKGANMNTIKIYLAESGSVATLSKDFPLYQGQYQNKLLNVYVPTSILEPELNTTQHYIGATSGSNYPNATILNDFVSSQIVRPSGEASPQKYDRVDYTQTTTPNNILCQCIFNGSSWNITEVDEFAPPYFANANNVSIGCVSVSRDGTQYKSTERAMRYVKTLTYNNVEYALYERKLPKEITNFSGVGVNAPTLVINVINYDLSSKTVIDIITSQECSLDVMPSTILDKDEPVEASELQILQANVSSLNTSSGQQATAITNLKNRMASAENTITSHGTRITTLENTVASGETFIGTMTITSATLPTDEELDAFVLQEEERQAKGGDSVIVIQQIAYATDKNYKYIRNATTWTHYEIPAMEKADNGSLGIVKGTYGTGSTNDIQVDITNGEIKEIYADNGTKLSDTIEYANDIKDGTKVVEKSNKAQYDFNGVQLLNVNNGASKTYVRDYALPKEFNQAHYLQSDGLTFALTQPTSGNISVSVPASIGYTTLFDATYTIPDNMKFQIAGKNGYASSFKLSSSAVKGGKFVLTTKISTDSGATFISADVITSDEISFGIGEIKELKFENKFDDLTDVYVLETGDKIEQKLELLSESSVATTITLYTSTYPSRMYLNTMSYAIITSSGLLGEITDLQGVATIGENITIKVDDATNLNDKCLYELSFSANLTGNLGKNIYLTRDNVESIAINSYLGTGKASDLVMYEIGNTQAYKLLLYYKDNAFYMQNYNIEKLVEGSTYINVELNATDSKLVVELDETNIETETAHEDSGKLITSGAVFDDLAEIKSELESTNLTDTNNSLLRTTGGNLAIKDGQELVTKVEGASQVVEVNGVNVIVSSNNEYKNTNEDNTKSALLSYNGTLERKVGVRAYQSGDENNSTLLTDLTNTYYPLTTPIIETIVNATNVELRGVGTAKDTLTNESGIACWKNGLTEQVNKNGIVAIPYTITEEFAVSINGQLQHNLEVDKAQQSEIQEIDSKIPSIEVNPTSAVDDTIHKIKINGVTYQFAFADPHKAKIYGVSGFGNSSTSLTRLGDAVGKTFDMSSGSTITSDFDSCYPWSDITRIVDENGNCFMRFPKCYFKAVKNSSGNLTALYVSGVRYDGYFTLHHNGQQEVDYLDIGCYEGSGSASRVYSKSGQTCLVNITRNQARVGCKANGTQYHQQNIQDTMLLMYLMWIEFATTNIQSIFMGNSNTSSATATGTTDSISTPSGASALQSSVSFKYRGVENVYANIWKFIDGINFQDGKIYYNPDNSSYADDTFTGGYKYIGDRCMTSGYVSQMGVFDDIVYPTAVGGGATTYYSDYYYQATGNRILFFGGSWSSGAYTGFYFDGNNASSNANSSIGCRLCRTPL